MNSNIRYRRPSNISYNRINGESDRDYKRRLTRNADARYRRMTTYGGRDISSNRIVRQAELLAFKVRVGINRLNEINVALSNIVVGYNNDDRLIIREALIREKEKFNRFVVTNRELVPEVEEEVVPSLARSLSDEFDNVANVRANEVSNFNSEVNEFRLLRDELVEDDLPLQRAANPVSVRSFFMSGAVNNRVVRDDPGLPNNYNQVDDLKPCRFMNLEERRDLEQVNDKAFQQTKMFIYVTKDGGALISFKCDICFEIVDLTKKMKYDCYECKCCVCDQCYPRIERVGSQFVKCPMCRKTVNCFKKNFPYDLPMIFREEASNVREAANVRSISSGCKVCVYCDSSVLETRFDEHEAECELRFYNIIFASSD